MNPTSTNHQYGAHVTTTVEKAVAIRRVTMVERGAVWDDRVIYDSTTSPDLTRRRDRVKYAAKQPQHRHVLKMWGAALALFSVLLAAMGSDPAAFAIFAPVIQETFTHWSMT